MRKYTLTLLAAFAVAGTSFAGTAVTSKEYKQPVVTPCFRDSEFAVDLFYTYNDAVHNGGRQHFDGTRQFDANGSEFFQGLDENRYFRDGSGGGIGFDYFFARYFGISVEGNWWVGVNTNQVRGVAFTNASGGTTIVASNGATVGVANSSTGTVNTVSTNRSGSDFHDVANQVTGSFILRYPFEGKFCWAPYALLGGGGVFDGRSTGFGTAGLGAEYRITPNIGVFTDWRWEWMANRNDVNTTRAGVRFAF